ncbi:MAG TPA: YetF domain-containing protein [Verrucomicrobiae bacterium]|nr:YetF domain-containing protein [Verrucomicrobiae bacterium]
MSTLKSIADVALGLNLDARNIHFYQILIRSVIVFFALLCMIRLAGRRFLANRNSLDVLLTFLLASLLARAINGNTEFFGTIGAGFFLAALYRSLAWLTCRSPWFGRWLKGLPVPLVDQGQIRKHDLNRHHVSEDDLMEDLRLNGKVNDVSNVRLAQLERSGEISVIKNE